MRKLPRFLALSRPEQRLLIHALIALPLCAVALRLVGFRRLYGALSRLAPLRSGSAAAATEAQPDRIDRTAWAVRVAATHGLVRGHCLQQSLTLWWLLRRQRLECEIRFGARRHNDKVEAHAWVESGGVAVTDGPEGDRTFAPFTLVRTNAEAGGR